MDWMRRLSEAIGRPVTYALTQNNSDPTSWKRLLDLSAAAAAEGVAVRPQVHGRTVSLLLGFQTFHPLAFTPTWGEAGLGLLPWPEQVARITGDPELRARIVADAAGLRGDPIVMGFMRPRASSCWATRPSTSRAPSAARRRSPPLAAWTSGSCCSTCSSRTAAASC
jgi:hypothetical protein